MNATKTERKTVCYMFKTNITLAIVAAIMFLTLANLQAITVANGQTMTSTTEGGQPDIINTTATVYTAQRTAKSTVDTLPGHQAHQAVVALPWRTDGKIWVGTLTWAASDPIEIRLLQNYNSSITTDTNHTSTPITGPFAPLGVSALSLIIPANQGVATLAHYNGGSINFAANQVAFHNIGGTPFIVTYSVDAVAKSLNNTISK
jgi:hypothetical protein